MTHPFQNHPKISRSVPPRIALETGQPELEFAIHYSYEHRNGVGTYTVTSLNQMRETSTETITANSSDEVVIIAIIDVLQGCAPNGKVIIITSNSGLMQDLGSKQFLEWKRCGWRGANGKPLARAGLFKALVEAIGNRTVSFRYESTRKEMNFSQPWTRDARTVIRRPNSRR